MLKQLLLLNLSILLMSMTNSIHAKTKECPIKPAFDIVVSDNSAHLVNDMKNIIIDANGMINMNGSPLKVGNNVQQQAKNLHAFLRQQLPDFAYQSQQNLDNVRSAFKTAIREQLGNKSELAENLDGLYFEVKQLLQNTIITRDGVTYFYYQPFNTLKKDGEAIGKKRFYKIVGNSVLHFDVFKNFSTVKTIAKNEWKEQKVKLKQFDAQICELITQIDHQYNQLILQLGQY